MGALSGCIGNQGLPSQDLFCYNVPGHKKDAFPRRLRFEGDFVNIFVKGLTSIIFSGRLETSRESNGRRGERCY